MLVRTTLTQDSFVHQYDEEYAEVKKTRRPGRPASVKEDMLKMKIAALEEEYRIGFCQWPLLSIAIERPLTYFQTCPTSWRTPT